MPWGSMSSFQPDRKNLDFLLQYYNKTFKITNGALNCNSKHVVCLIKAKLVLHAFHIVRVLKYHSGSPLAIMRVRIASL